MTCHRCGKPAHHTWASCARAEMFDLCDDCDILVNRVVLDFLVPKESPRLIRNYRGRVKTAALRRARRDVEMAGVA